MAQHFNSNAQLFILLLLAVVRGAQELFPEFKFWPLAIDIISIYSILYLVGGYLGFVIKNFSRLPRLLAAWGSTAEARRLLSIIREFSLWLSVGFLGLRISRWSSGWRAGWEMRGVDHYHSYFSAAIVCLVIAWALSLPKVQHWLRGVNFTSGRKLLLYYIFLAAVATILLILPVSLQPGKALALIDAAFIVVSAISVTGLVPVNIAETLSIYGQSLVLFLIQIGGLGIVMLSAGLAAATLRRMSVAHSLLSKELYDITDIGNMGQFLTKVFVLTLSLELIGATFLFFSMPADIPDRLFHSIFHAVSAFCNAGFSSFPENLEYAPFGGVGMWTVSLLIVFGGIGFPVLIDLISSLKPMKRYRSLNANTRLSIWTFLVLFLLGASGIFLMESFSPFANSRSWLDNLGYSAFYSISSRTAGFNQLPVDQLSMTSIVVIMFMMIIGGSPLSTAGGLKTTTVAVLAVAAWSNLRGLETPQFGNRSIANKTIMRALTGLCIYAAVAVTAILILTITESVDPWSLMFEVISAMSTVGLSLGATGDLTMFGKMLVIFLMMAGRVGLVTFMYAGLGKRQTQRYKVPQDQFFVG